MPSQTLRSSAAKKTTSNEAIRLEAQLSCIVHVILKVNDKILEGFFGELYKGRGKQGKPLKHFQDCNKADYT